MHTSRISLPLQQRQILITGVSYPRQGLGGRTRSPGEGAFAPFHLLAGFSEANINIPSHCKDFSRWPHKTPSFCHELISRFILD
jgi:hypothetical protein